jgi:hypothetical protein
MSAALDFIWHLIDHAITAILDWQPIPTVVH